MNRNIEYIEVLDIEEPSIGNKVDETPTLSDITSEMAKSGLRVFKEFCMIQRQKPQKCNYCQLLSFCMSERRRRPCDWEYLD